MLNNRGQSLVLFVIILPVILLLGSILLEFSYLAYQKAKVYSVSKTIIANCLDGCEKNDIIELYNDNKIAMSDFNYDYDDGLTIKGTVNIPSLFGNIINHSEYDIGVYIYGYKDGQAIKYKKGK